MKALGMCMFATIDKIEETESFLKKLSLPKPGNHRSQATVRREIRRRSNLPKAIQKRLGFKCH